MNKEGQSTAEYFVLVAAVIVVLLVFSSKNGFFQKELNKTLGITSNMMVDSANAIFN